MVDRDSGQWEARRRSMSGDFDVRTASQAIDLIVETGLRGTQTVSDGLVDVCFLFTRGGLRAVS